MPKSLLMALLSGVLGAALGFGGAQMLTASDSDTDRPAVVDESESLDDARLAALEERLEQTRDENARLRAQLAEREEMGEVAAVPEEERSTVDLNRVFGALTPDDKNIGEHLAAEALEAAEEERRAEWRARREEWSNNFRGGMESFLDASYAAATDPAEQERIAALGEYGEAMFELRRQMEAATTDEERAAAGAAMRENFEGMRSLMQDQQDHMLREVLENVGIDKARQQQKLMEELRATMESPFFRFGGGMGGGFGGPGGGRGGPRGGGGSR